MTRHLYEISALVPQTSFRGETSGGVTKCRLFSQANVLNVVAAEAISQSQIHDGGQVWQPKNASVFEHTHGVSTHFTVWSYARTPSIADHTVRVNWRTQSLNVHCSLCVPLSARYTILMTLARAMGPTWVCSLASNRSAYPCQFVERGQFSVNTCFDALQFGSTRMTRCVLPLPKY